tara:strand:- start:12366 stop:13262 length:897 start_codon:yes stop_codon:yes gene_type:complete
MSDVPPLRLTADILWSFVNMTKNNLYTLGSYKNILRNIIISPFPCHASKSVTDKICEFNLDGLTRSITNFKPIGFKQIRHLANNSRSLVKNMMTGGQTDEDTQQLKNNIREINRINKKNKDSIMCGISKFFTHGICKINEINVRLLTDGLKVGLIGTNIIPDKVASALDSVYDITESELDGEDLEDALGDIDGDLEDINDVNDSMEEALDDDEKKIKKSNKSKKQNNQKKRVSPKNNRKGNRVSSPRSKGRSSKRGKSRGRRQRGGNFTNIIDPISNKSVNILSKRGQQLIKIYSHKL